jgi:hypothetical protein
MKRDMELLRKMVLCIEDSPRGYAPHPIKIEGYADDKIGYHAYLLTDAGLTVGADTGASSGPEYVILNLTSAGHDFADACRNDTVWKKATGIVAEKAGTVTLDVFMQLLANILKQTIGLS